MAHIEDRWFKPKRDDNGNIIRNAKGKPVLEKTDRYGRGDRYRVRYVDPNGKPQNETFPDKKKGEAEAFLIDVESKKQRGAYIDPSAGRVLFRDYAEDWLRTRVFDESSREATEYKVRKHLLPFFGCRQLISIKPGDIREWDSSLVDKLASSTRSVIFAHLRAILNAAVDDEKIPKNPCSAKSVQPPRTLERKVIPWTFEQVRAVQAALADRYKLIVDVGSGCGLRPGESFGLGADDFDGERLHVARQVKRVRSRLVFDLPKNDRDRWVPLPKSVAAAIIRHIEAHPPVKVTLPWQNPASGEMVTVPLLFTTTRRGALNRETFHSKIWRPALIKAGVEVERKNGPHALRHFYASALLDAGRSVKAVSEYLGHHDPGFTLRVYMHLMPGDEDKTRDVLDELFEGPVTSPDHSE